MNLDSALRHSVKHHEIVTLAKEAIENGGLVREAFVRSGLMSYDMNNQPVKRFEYDTGICIQQNGESKVFFSDCYSDRLENIEVNLASEDVNVQLGNALTEAGFDYNYAHRLREQGKEVIRFQDVLPHEVLVENGKSPTPVQIKVRSLLKEMHDNFGTPVEVSIPVQSRTDQSYDKLLVELKKLSQNLDKQSEFAHANNAMPKYPFGVLDMMSNHYKKFKRDVAKNVARSHANGMLFTMEGKGDSGISISVQAPNGDVVGSLEMDSSFETEYWEYDVVTGDPIEVEVKSLPDVSKMSQKGMVSDNFRDLVSKMRNDFSLVSPVTTPTHLVSNKDIDTAVSVISADISNSGKSPLNLSSDHPDIMSAKLTYLLSQKYPEIIKSGMVMVNESKRENSVDNDFSPIEP